MAKANLTEDQKLLIRLGVENRKLLEEYLQLKREGLRKQLEVEPDVDRVKLIQGQIKMIKDILKDGEHINA